MEQWMTNLAEGLTTVPLNQLAIPGSHDSGAFDLTTELSPSAPSAARTASSLIPGFMMLFGGLLIDLAATQTLNIGQQLNAGIRHFDFRVASKSNDFLFVHSVYGSKVSLALDQIRTFLDDHPKEVIILDMHQFHQFSAEDHKRFIKMLKDKFGNKFVQETEIKDLTLKYLWEQKKQIICFYSENSFASENKELWSRTYITDPWPDTASGNKVIKLLTEYMNQAKKETDKFSVCQAVLTPDVGYIFKHLLTNKSIKRMTKDHLNPVLKPWLVESSKHWTHLPNIVLKDFVELDGFVQSVLDLNTSRNPSKSS